ncbi:hypothetical protein HOC54_03645, partial [Candidatus Peregrinibacteria bacterium]|nr:hypothetical protein [Candidatus Peregrinibacteria bacterium]
MSAGQNIEEELKTTPNMSFDELKRLFPNIKKKSVQQQVSEYLDKNTEASFDTLKSAFPDISPNSLSAYKSVWKK